MMIVDRVEGFVWCDVCAPAEVALLAREVNTAKPKRRLLLTRVGPRFVAVVEPVRASCVGLQQPLGVALRCRGCGAVQP